MSFCSLKPRHPWNSRHDQHDKIQDISQLKTWKPNLIFGAWKSWVDTPKLNLMDVALSSLPIHGSYTFGAKLPLLCQRHLARTYSQGTMVTSQEESRSSGGSQEVYTKVCPESEVTLLEFPSYSQGLSFAPCGDDETLFGLRTWQQRRGS